METCPTWYSGWLVEYRDVNQSLEVSKGEIQREWLDRMMMIGRTCEKHVVDAWPLYQDVMKRNPV